MMHKAIWVDSDVFAALEGKRDLLKMDSAPLNHVLRALLSLPQAKIHKRKRQATVENRS